MGIMWLVGSDTTAVAAVFMLGVFALIACSIGGLIVNRAWGRRTWWGLTIALVPLVLGGLAFVFLLTVRGGAPSTFRMLALLPLLVGLRSLQLWGRQREL